MGLLHRAGRRLVFRRRFSFLLFFSASRPCGAGVPWACFTTRDAVRASDGVFCFFSFFGTPPLRGGRSMGLLHHAGRRLSFRRRFSFLLFFWYPAPGGRAFHGPALSRETPSGLQTAFFVSPLFSAPRPCGLCDALVPKGAGALSGPWARLSPPLRSRPPPAGSGSAARRPRGSPAPGGWSGTAGGCTPPPPWGSRPPAAPGSPPPTRR